MTQTTRKVLKSIFITLACIILALILIVGSYALYLTCQYYRIDDNLEITTENNSSNLLSLDTSYKITTYNIGFGSYTQDFSFFMDTGVMKGTGQKTHGTGSRAKSKESVLTCTEGAANQIAAQNADIMLFQEVDTESHRSHFVNQYQMLTDEFTNYGTNFASNFHSGYLFYPFSNPHGKVNSGIATYSKFKIDSTVRRTFPIDESFPNKFFDLDRCFTINKMPIQGTEKCLVLINLHMSAYDEGGVYRAKQLKMLFEYVAAEYAQGNYVIAGGDWNHDIAGTKDYFPTDEEVPNWVGVIDESELPTGFSFATAKNVPTCRSTDIVYTKKDDGTLVNYSVVLDGFLISGNVTAELNQNIDTDFKYSDHNPAYMQFKLNV